MWTLTKKKRLKRNNTSKRITTEDRPFIKPMTSICRESSMRPKWRTSCCRPSCNIKITWGMLSRTRKTRRTRRLRSSNTTSGCKRSKRWNRRKTTKWSSDRTLCSRLSNKKNAARENKSSSTKTWPGTTQSLTQSSTTSTTHTFWKTSKNEAVSCKWVRGSIRMPGTDWRRKLNHRLLLLWFYHNQKDKLI